MKLTIIADGVPGERTGTTLKALVRFLELIGGVSVSHDGFLEDPKSITLHFSYNESKVDGYWQLINNLQEKHGLHEEAEL